MLQVGLLGFSFSFFLRLKSTKNTHIYSTSTEYCGMSSKPERAYSDSVKDVAFSRSSISLHPAQIFPFRHLFAGKIHIALFSAVLNQDLFKKRKEKQKRFWGYDPSMRWHHTLYLQSVFILVCRTELWRGKPLDAGAAWEDPFAVRVLQLVQDAGRSSAIGSVWARIKAVTETGNSDFCLCAAGLRVLKGSRFPFTFLFFNFFFNFKTSYLLKCASPPLLLQEGRVRLIQRARAIWVCGNVQFGGPALSGTRNTKQDKYSIHKTDPGQHPCPPFRWRRRRLTAGDVSARSAELWTYYRFIYFFLRFCSISKFFFLSNFIKMMLKCNFIFGFKKIRTRDYPLSTVHFSKLEPPTEWGPSPLAWGVPHKSIKKT